ncbi:DUF5060 domain-containing protein [Roseibacillus persicicus]|uniref:DUF5060 domain-containing protein n=1 Tax=Roseibacillus persicicus TaxID=454148 RepID=A0A918TC21_9BACT|nr:DUF5060 domain-containing protein [Roseibacillus persicicus]GHC40297.1 hypothetical protein GCM10007100_00890 [Roseibacillus persicicus]
MKILTLLTVANGVVGAESQLPLAKSDLVFAEKGGIVAIEAEHFTKQELADTRAWYLTTRDQTPQVEPDGDPSHIAGASGGAYLEILPDTRRTHGDKLITGENFSNEPGKLAVLSYPVHFETPGTYWLWARACSTTSEDNGLHFGINGTWPETAQRWQTIVKNKWHWKSAQRTEKVHVGVPGILTLEVPSAGVHTIQVSMREDGIALDKILLVNRKDYTPEGTGPDSAVQAGSLPKAFPVVKEGDQASPSKKQVPAPKSLFLSAKDFQLEGSSYYLDQGKWAAINPDQHKAANASTPSPFPAGVYNLTLRSVGENDGSSTFALAVNDEVVGLHQAPLSEDTFDESARFHATFQKIEVNPGDVIKVSSVIASADGKEYARARWSGIAFQPADEATRKAVAKYKAPQKKTAEAKPAGPPLQLPRQANGDGSVVVSGELQQWHAVSLTFDGPYAHELDNQPNPFTDYDLSVTFTHDSGKSLQVPGYFAADGNAGESSAQSGTKWRVHFSPPAPGKWSYQVSLLTAPGLITGEADKGKQVKPLHGKTGTFEIAASDKQAPDFRARGRLAYVGKNLLQFQGDKSYFLKAGADAPETLLGYADFDDTKALNPKKVPLKTWSAHVRDWNEGDPTWKDGKGKGLIGALNYLAEEGCNAFSFLPYNVDGDGSNVWPFVAPRDKMHYDCSKLDQWNIVFDHATAKGLFLHFKMQETEIDDNRAGHKGNDRIIRSSLDGGDLGPERRLYCRELIARFGHHLALNWNLGEENTQSTKQQMDMAKFVQATDPYDNHVVIHTFPDQQDKVYNPLLGEKAFTGVSLQNSNLKDCHKQVLKWIKRSNEKGQPWAVAFDEPGDASIGMPADPDYPGMPKDYQGPSIHDCRKYTLWGTFMAGGMGVEYYFGYKLPQNDLICEDWRSRDLSWDYCRHALNFFRDQNIPMEAMVNRNDLVGNTKDDNSKYCLAKEGEVYLVYLPTGGSTKIELPSGDFTLTWFNPRTGEMGQTTTLQKPLTAPDKEDWLALIRKK